LDIIVRTTACPKGGAIRHGGAIYDTAHFPCPQRSGARTSYIAASTIAVLSAIIKHFESSDCLKVYGIGGASKAAIFHVDVIVCFHAA
jgi:hypothetical protein